MYELTTSIYVKEKQFSITNNGDFRVILDCFSTLTDRELSKEERIYASLIIFYDEFNCIEDINRNAEYIQDLVLEMFKFFNSGKVVDESANARKPKLIDWEKDEDIIMPAINNVARKEIRLEPYIHWWTFMGYYMSIGESVLSTVVSIRNKIATGEKLEKYEAKYKRDNPQYFNRSFASDEDILSADEFIKEVWNK